MSNFKLDNDNKDRKLKEYIRLLELAKSKYRKVEQENNLLKRQILVLRQSRPKQKKQIKRKYIVENSDRETDSPYESDYQENKEKEEDQYPETKEKKSKNKNCEKTKSKQKTKVI